MRVCVNAVSLPGWGWVGCALEGLEGEGERSVLSNKAVLAVHKNNPKDVILPFSLQPFEHVVHWPSPSTRTAFRSNPRPHFMSAHIIISRLCGVAGSVSAKKPICILLGLVFNRTPYYRGNKLKLMLTFNKIEFPLLNLCS